MRTQPSLLVHPTLLTALCGLATTLCLAGPPLADDFSAGTLSEKWAAAKGAWTIEEGWLKGAELPEDKHAAVLSLTAPHHDSTASFAFQLAGADEFHLSFNHPKGHLFRIVVSGKEARLNTDKDKKDPESKVVLLDKKETGFAKGETHTLTCEIRGETVTARFDNGLELKGTHPSLAAEKTGFRLVVKGDAARFDDFVVSELK